MLKSVGGLITGNPLSTGVQLYYPFYNRLLVTTSGLNKTIFYKKLSAGILECVICTFLAMYICAVYVVYTYGYFEVGCHLEHSVITK